MATAARGSRFSGSAIRGPSVGRIASDIIAGLVGRSEAVITMAIKLVVSIAGFESHTAAAAAVWVPTLCERYPADKAETGFRWTVMDKACVASRLVQGQLSTWLSTLQAYSSALPS